MQRYGLWEAVHGPVLICLHKEDLLGGDKRLYPARRYSGRQARILAAIKEVWAAPLKSCLATSDVCELVHRLSGFGRKR